MDLATQRRRLTDVARFMGTPCEHLTRRFHRESGKRSAFWGHRFGGRSLAKEGAVLLCGTDEDLNAIRVGEAWVSEEAIYTSAHSEIGGRRLSASGPSVERPAGAGADDWLCSLMIREDDPDQLGAARSHLVWQASEKGLMAISLENDLELRDWTGRPISSRDQGAILPSRAWILARRGIRTEH